MNSIAGSDPIVGLGVVKFTSRPGAVALGIRLLDPPLPANEVL